MIGTACNTGPNTLKEQLGMNVAHAEKQSMISRFRTMGQLLSEEGYSTHYIGKWHLGYASYKYFPTNRGFDSFVGFMQPHNTVYSHRFGDPAKVDGFDFWNNTELFREVDGVHSNNVFLKELDRVVGKAAESDKASFVIFAPASIHMPLEHPPANYSACENVASGSRRTLCNMMGNFDETVGGVVETYKKGGIWDDTLMVFLSDNGGSVPGVVGESFHAADSSNFPLRAGKGTLFEGGVRSLGFVQGGKTVIPEHARGSIKTDLIHVADLLPTAFAAANSRELPADVDGVNQWPSLTGSSGGPRTELPINIQPEASSIIVGQWKLIVGTPLYDGLWTVSPYVRIEPPTHGAADGDDFLFNIFDDPTEQFNVARDYPSVVADLKDRIASYVNSPSYMDPSDNGKNDVPREALPIFNGDSQKLAVSIGWLKFEISS
eukprot:gene8028-12348_t